MHGKGLAFACRGIRAGIGALSRAGAGEGHAVRKAFVRLALACLVLPGALAIGSGWWACLVRAGEDQP